MAPHDDAAGRAADPDLIARGAALAVDRGCAACHGSSFAGGVGPSWVGLAGSKVSLADGTVAVADDAYLARSIVDPGADVVDGYVVPMPVVDLAGDDVDALVAFIRSLDGP
jgi:cytochrome c oxidase subunit 2